MHQPLLHDVCCDVHGGGPEIVIINLIKHQQENLMLITCKHIQFAGKLVTRIVNY